MITSCGPSSGGGGNQNVYNVKSIETHRLMREAVILKARISRIFISSGKRVEQDHGFQDCSHLLKQERKTFHRGTIM